LRQVLINLVHNAIKFSPSGASISVHVSHTDKQTATVEITDNGLGIPPEHRERVFDRFYRIDEGRSREAGGAGLGLAIAKWGAEAHGGQLKLTCPADGGCVFRLLLPVAGGANGKSRSKPTGAVSTHSEAETQASQPGVKVPHR
jgi:signal transduction histidine kinase